MKKSLQDKLKKYGTMAAAVAGGVASADAQIIYTDIVPDTTFCNDGDVYNLDLNNDMINDFSLNLNTSSNAGGFYSNSLNFSTNSNENNDLRISPNGLANSVLGNNASALSSGASIGSSATNWANSSGNLMASYSMYYSRYASTSTYYNTSASTTYTYTWGPYTYSNATSFGDFAGAQSKYLGLKIVVGPNTHYGWARVSVDSGVGCFTVEEYAYETTPNTTILAGDKGLSTSISDLNLIPDVTVFAANEVLNVQVPKEVIGFNVKLVDMLGRTIVNETIASSNHKVDIANNSNGVYIVLIEGEGKAFSEKITIN
ncbi:MAG: T9SS type A sorting domain-containing protein [Vicingaceae bacterium]|nr:T9SS type A sorting domain-containing protein [Vicingaceae bacterium]